MRKTTIALALALGAAAGAASAATIGGVTINPGSFLEIGTVWEGTKASDGAAPITATGDILAGVGTIDTIKDGGGNVTWASGQGGVYLAFWFDNFKTEAIKPLGAPTPINILFSGGDAHFYTLASPFAPAPVQSLATDVATISAGSLWMDTVGGASLLCAPTDGCISGAGTPVTLSSFILAGSLGAIGSGVGNGFLNVTGAGPADALVDTNTFPGPGGALVNDLALGSSFNAGASTAGYAASGSVDIRGKALPEPATLGLVALSLLGVGGLRRRKSA